MEVIGDQLTHHRQSSATVTIISNPSEGSSNNGSVGSIKFEDDQIPLLLHLGRLGRLNININVGK